MKSDLQKSWKSTRIHPPHILAQKHGIIISTTTMQLSGAFSSFADRESDVHYGDEVYIHAGKHAGKTGVVLHAPKKGKKMFGIGVDGERGPTSVRKSSFYPVRKDNATSVDRFFAERPHIEFHYWVLCTEFRSARFTPNEMNWVFDEMMQHVVGTLRESHPTPTPRSSMVTVIQEEDVSADEGE